MEILEYLEKSITPIKILSTVLIVSAIGLELGNFYALQAQIAIPHSLKMILGLGRFAMAAHAIEGIIAAFFASARQKEPIKYSFYTFFVGTVGLWELLNSPSTGE